MRRRNFSSFDSFTLAYALFTLRELPFLLPPPDSLRRRNCDNDPLFIPPNMPGPLLEV